MHLKRYSIPKYWKVAKKAEKFVVSPRPGPHKKFECVPLLVLTRDVLKMCETAKEARSVIKAGKIMVDKKQRKDTHYPVGFMDVIEMPGSKNHYRVSVDRQGLMLEEIGASSADRKLCRIQNKRIIRGGMVQLNLHDGRNVITERKGYNPNDSLLIEVPSQKIIKHFKFEKGAPAMVISGKNLGVRGKVKEVFDRKIMTERNRVVLETKEGDMETVKEYVLVGECK